MDTLLSPIHSFTEHYKAAVSTFYIRIVNHMTMKKTFQYLIENCVLFDIKYWNELVKHLRELYFIIITEFFRFRYFVLN